MSIINNILVSSAGITGVMVGNYLYEMDKKAEEPFKTAKAAKRKAAEKFATMKEKFSKKEVEAEQPEEEFEDAEILDAEDAGEVAAEVVDTTGQIIDAEVIGDKAVAVNVEATEETTSEPQVTTEAEEPTIPKFPIVDELEVKKEEKAAPVKEEKAESSKSSKRKSTTKATEEKK